MSCSLPAPAWARRCLRNPLEPAQKEKEVLSSLYFAVLYVWNPASPAPQEREQRRELQVSSEARPVRLEPSESPVQPESFVPSARPVLRAFAVQNYVEAISEA